MRDCKQLTTILSLLVQRRRERAQPARRAQKNGLPDCIIWYCKKTTNVRPHNEMWLEVKNAKVYKYESSNPLSAKVRRQKSRWSIIHAIDAWGILIA